MVIILLLLHAIFFFLEQLVISNKQKLNMPENLNNKLFYNTVLCQTFSPSGKHLVAGNIYGDISVFE